MTAFDEDAFAPELSLSLDGAVCTVTLNRPDKLNAVDERLHSALVSVWAVLAADPRVAAAVLTGSGRAFTAGGDMAKMDRMNDPLNRARAVDEAQHLVRNMLSYPAPIVTAINGPAVGLGCSLALCSDVVLIEESAFLSDPHVVVGLVAGDGGAALMPLLGPVLRVKELLFTGQRISAEEAVQIGLATRVVPDGTSLERARELAARFATMPQQALRDTKRAVNMHLERGIAGVLEFAATAERESLHSADHLSMIQRFRKDE